jgi:anti-sigma factor RsiW
MNCKERQETLESFLSEQLDAEGLREIEAHVQQCAACATALAEARALWTLLGRVPTREPSFGFAERVLRQLDARPEPDVSWWTRFRRVALTAAAVVVVVVAILAIQQRNRAEEQRARVRHFEELFHLVQNVDADSLLDAAAYENGEPL